jgi:hypothetical protein
MKFPSFLILTFWLGNTCSSVQAAVTINEFMAANTAGLVDEDGQTSDWIELYNSDASPVGLGDYALTDNATNPAKWRFPAGATIPANGYLLVYASGKNRQVVGQNLHTNFSLSAAGEYLGLYLVNPSTTLVDHYAPLYPSQTDNVSYGKLDTGSGVQLVYLTTASPLAANLPAHAPAEAVAFSLSSMTFLLGNTLSLSLSVVSPTAEIRYTTDRSAPTATSPLYTTPLSVTTATRVRARAYEGVVRPAGVIRSEMYLPIDAAGQAFTSTLPIVITHTWGVGPASDVTNQAQIMLFEPKAPSNLARMTNLPDVARPGTVERRGSSTAADPKYSLTVEFWDEADLDQAVPILGMPSDSDWVMHAPYNYDRSLMHNDLIYRISNEAGRYAMRTKFVEHFHNSTIGATLLEGALTAAGDYFGVYSFMEKIDRGSDRVDVENLTTVDNVAPNVQGGYILKVDRVDAGDAGLRPLGGRSFGNVGRMGAGDNLMAFVTPKQASPDPSLIVTTAQYNYISGYISDMWDALSGVNFMDPVNGYAKWIDPAAAIDHQIFNTATKNADGMRLSGYWHKPRFGRMTAGPIWDFDRAQGSTDGRDLIPTTWRGDVADLGTDFFHYPWYGEMFKDPNFWQAWVDRLHELRQGVMSTSHIHALIDEFAAQVNPGDAVDTPAKRNGTRWLGYRGAGASTPGTNGTYAGEVLWLKNWWQSRLNFMDGQFVRPAVSTLTSGPVSSGSTATLTSPTTAGATIYYTTDGSDPRARATIPAVPVGASVTISTLIPEISTVRAIVPTSATTGGAANEWRGLGFDDSTWFTNPAGTLNGVGYDDDLAVSYIPFIGLRWSSALNNVAPANTTNTMRNTNGSCYIRHTFTLTAGDLALAVAPNKLTLQVRFDDGYVAWINGGLAINTSTNATAFTNPAWNAVLTTSKEANGYEEVDISSALSKLVVGTNVLALQALNGSNTGSSDLVCGVKLLLQGTPNPFITAELSPAATAYAGPLTVTAPTQIFARTFTTNRYSDPPTTTAGGTGSVPNGSSWSAPTRLYYFPGAVAASQASIQISEVNYHPPAPTAAEITAGWLNANDFEFVRLTNTGVAPVDLTGIYFSNGLTFTAAPGLQNWLPAGQSVVVVENLAAFQSRYGSGFTVLGEFSGELDDGGEHIVLNDKTGAIISDFVYGDSAPWPTSADGQTSLVYVGGNQNDAASWLPSIDPGGTGVANYAAFKQRRFSPAGTPIPSQAADQDPDKDGLKNVLEYALGLNPLNPDPQAFHDAVNATNALVVRRRIAADLTYEFQASSDLGTWTPGPATSAVNNGDGTETCTFSPPSGTARTFLQMKVTLLP